MTNHCKLMSLNNNLAFLYSFSLSFFKLSVQVLFINGGCKFYDGIKFTKEAKRKRIKED